MAIGFLFKYTMAMIVPGRDRRGGDRAPEIRGRRHEVTETGKKPRRHERASGQEERWPALGGAAVCMIALAGLDAGADVERGA
jgi:hypothetical protein